MRKGFVPVLQVPPSIMVSEKHSSISQDTSNIHKMQPERLRSFIADITCQRGALLPKNRSRNIKAPSSADNIWSHLHLLILEQSQEERAAFSTLKANIYLPGPWMTGNFNQSHLSQGWKNWVTPKASSFLGQLMDFLHISQSKNSIYPEMKLASCHSQGYIPAYNWGRF